MSRMGGLKIWGRSGDAIRVFMVAIPEETEALRLLETAHPDIVILSRHWMSQTVLDEIEITQGTGTEIVHLDPKQRYTQLGGVPLDRPLNKP